MKRFLVFTMCIMALVAFGCGGDSKKAAAPAKEQKTVQLAAAASLEKVFEQQLIPMFNKKHPEIKIQGVKQKRIFFITRNLIAAACGIVNQRVGL